MDNRELPHGIDSDILRRLKEKVKIGKALGKLPDESLNLPADREKFEMVIGDGVLKLTLRALQEEKENNVFWEAYHPEEGKKVADLAGTDLASLFLELRSERLAAEVLLGVDIIRRKASGSAGFETEYQAIDSSDSLEFLVSFGFDASDMERNGLRKELGRTVIAAYEGLAEMSRITDLRGEVGQVTAEAYTHHVLRETGNKFIELTMGAQSPST